jgi:hypothetical protein
MDSSQTTGCQSSWPNKGSRDKNARADADKFHIIWLMHFKVVNFLKLQKPCPKQAFNWNIHRHRFLFHLLAAYFHRKKPFVGAMFLGLFPKSDSPSLSRSPLLVP